MAIHSKSIFQPVVTMLSHVFHIFWAILSMELYYEDCYSKDLIPISTLECASLGHEHAISFEPTLNSIDCEYNSYFHIPNKTTCLG